MASHPFSLSEDSRRCELKPKESHARVKSQMQQQEIPCPPQVSVDLSGIKQERNEDDCSQGSHVVPRLSFVDENQTYLVGNCPPNQSRELNHDIKQRKGAQSLSLISERGNRKEPSGAEENVLSTKKSTGSGEEDMKKLSEKEKKTDLSTRNDGCESNVTTGWQDKSILRKEQMPNKRKYREVYAEELPVRNDPRLDALGVYPRSYAFEYQVHQSKEREEREEKDRTQHKSEKLVCPQYIDKNIYADPTLARMEFHEMPPDYRLMNGMGFKLETRANEQIHRNITYFPPTDPRNCKYVITEDSRIRYVPEEQVYRALQDEAAHRLWYPKYGTLLANRDGSEHHFKLRSKEEFGSSPSREKFEHHYRLQQGSHWPHFDRSPGRGGIYDKQRISFLKTGYPGEENNNHAKDFPLTTEQSPQSGISVDECCKYVKDPNIVISTANPELFLNGVDLHTLQDMPCHSVHPFYQKEKGATAFIEGDSVFYPCCIQGIPNNYEDMAAKARWVDARNERQRVNAFQTLKPSVVLRDNPFQTLVFSESGARIIHANDIKSEEPNCLEKIEISKKVPLPNYRTEIQQHETPRDQFPFKRVLAAERQRLADGSRRIEPVLGEKGVVFSSYSTQNYQTKVLERKAREEKTVNWSEKVHEPKKSEENKMCEVNETGSEVQKNEGVQNGGNKVTHLQPMREATKVIQDMNNSELYPKDSLEKAKQNQDDATPKKTISCSVCNKTFNRTSNLYTHMRTHSANKPHGCEFCGKRFHQKADLRIHRYIHTGEKPHKCSKCGRGFKQLTHLKYHMRTHSDVRMYKCPYCEKGFNQKSNLQAHIFGHTGQRPHKCEICGKGFTLASTLNTHKRTHLPNKPFKCEFCDRAFYQKNALKMHYVSTHPYSSGACLV